MLSTDMMETLLATNQTMEQQLRQQLLVVLWGDRIHRSVMSKSLMYAVAQVGSANMDLQRGQLLPGGDLAAGNVGTLWRW